MIAYIFAFLLVVFPPAGEFGFMPQPQQKEVQQVPSVMDVLRSVGFSGNALNIAYAIVMAESGGNARAHNPDASTGDNSYGLFQINMLGGMGPERRKLYGLSSNEDLFDPYVNARVAYKMSNGGKNWQPWSTYKTGAYKSFLGQSSQQVTNSGTGGVAGKYSTSSGGGGPTAAPLSRNESAEQYGYVESMFDAIPELRSLFKKATADGWTAQKFQAELRNTNWWKTTSETERQFLVKQYGDPATAGQMWHTNQIKVQQIAGQMGANINWEYINRFAYGIMAKGWSEEQLREEISKFITIGPETRGQAGEVVGKLREFGYEMGVTVYDWWAEQQAREVVSGRAKIEDSQAHIRSIAKGLYSNWAKQIDAGQTVMQLASPYMQSMSQILELPPGSITLQDPVITKALQAKDPNTGENRVKQLWEFENELRSDSRWKKTKNAQDSMMQVAHQVLSDFGIKY